MFVRYVILFWCCLYAAADSAAQSGFVLPSGRKQIDIPFEYSNGFIILNLTFNRIMPLKFIFDTGAEHTILCKREVSDLLQVPYEREFKVTGSDLSVELVAYLARFVQFETSNQVKAPQEDILVLKDDYFRFEEYAGMTIHGIVSGNAFARYLIRINYARQLITLYDRSVFRLRDAGFQEMKLDVVRNKLYFNTTITVSNDSVVPVKLLIDTGAALPMLLFSNTHPNLQPPATAIKSNIGMGLGGFIEGFIGRTNKLSMGGSLRQQNVITYFQETDTSHLSSAVNTRNGLLGSSVLNRFDVILDYYEGKMWLKPNKQYKEKFVFDRSGLTIIASGRNLKDYVIQDVLTTSPAAKAKLQRGDVILRVGFTPAYMFSLNGLQRKLQGKVGKKIQLWVKRGEEHLKTTVVLQELL
jgi:PDZ domain